MSKLITVIVAAMFAAVSASAFAASHTGGMKGDKMDKMEKKDGKKKGEPKKKGEGKKKAEGKKKMEDKK